MDYCTFCGEVALNTLDGEKVCTDCLERVKNIPADDRQAFLIQSFQNLHGMLMKEPVLEYSKIWGADLARRLEHIQARPRVPAPAIGDTLVEDILNGVVAKEEVLQALDEIKTSLIQDEAVEPVEVSPSMVVAEEQHLEPTVRVVTIVAPLAKPLAKGKPIKMKKFR